MKRSFHTDFKDLRFLQAELQKIKSDLGIARDSRDEFTEQRLLENDRQTHELEDLVLNLSKNISGKYSSKLNMTLGQLLKTESVPLEGFTYTAETKKHDSELSKKADAITKTVDGFAANLEKVNELECQIHRRPKIKTRDLGDRALVNKTRMKVHPNDSNVSPLSLKVFKTS